MKKLKWILINSGVVFCVVYGVYLQNAWAANLLKFYIWLGFILVSIMWMVCHTPNIQAAAQKAPKKFTPAFGPRINLPVDLSIAAALAAFGWFGYAGLVTATAFLEGALWEQIKKGKEEKQ